MSGALPATRMGELVEKTNGALDLLFDSCIEIGHRPAPPVPGGAYTDETICLACEAAWVCPPVEQVLAAQRAVLRALRSLGVDEDMVSQSVPAATHASPCSRARVLRHARPS